MSDSKKINLRISTPDVSAEIFLLDGRSSLVDRGVGWFEKSLAPGLYKIQVRAGDRIFEDLLSLEPGYESLLGKNPVAKLVRRPDRVIVQYPGVDLISAVPERRDLWAPTHAARAAEWSQSPPQKFGAGGSLFVFVRQQHAGHPGQGLTLHDVSGKTILPLDAISQNADKAEAPWAACLLELDPGIYRLRRGGRSIPLEQSVVISPGWQTQVFLARFETDQMWEEMQTSILMSLPKKGFDPESPGVRLNELARTALENRQSRAADPFLRDLLYLKYESPLLGILAAHLYARKDREPRFMDEVIANLRKILGVHPDVEALALRRGVATGEFDAPPMLLSSWEIIVPASMKDSSLVTPGSLSSQIASRVWQESPWLLWSVPPQEKRPSASIDVKKQLRETLGDLFEKVQKDASGFSQDESYSERALLSLLKPDPDVALPRSKAPSSTMIIERLNMPPASVLKTSERLLHGMGPTLKNLLARAQEGRPPRSVWEAIVDQIRPLVTFGSRHQLPRGIADVEDVLQMILLKLQNPETLKQVVDAKSPSKYLVTMARNLALGMHERKPPPPPQPSRELSAEVVHWGERALKLLDEQERELVRLVYWEEVPRQEAAKRVGLSYGNAMTKLSRAKDKIERQLGKP